MTAGNPIVPLTEKVKILDAILADDGEGMLDVADWENLRANLSGSSYLKPIGDAYGLGGVRETSKWLANTFDANKCR